MKRIFLIACLAGLITSAFAQQPDLPNPPGTVWLRDSLFIDKTEITNIHWLEFRYFLKRDSLELTYELSSADTTVWTNASTPQLKLYWTYPGYRYHPVVGVSYEQAVGYCTWRTAIVNQQMASSNFMVEFRLPTEDEWIYAAVGNLELSKFPYGYESIYTKPTLRGDPELLYSQLVDTNMTFKEFKGALKKFKSNGSEPFFNVIKKWPGVTTYSALQPQAIIIASEPKDLNIDKMNQISKANYFGISDMIGNVAEMVLEKGIAKGGSWNHTLEESAINSRQYYNKPENWLGFRCVCEVKSKS
jgi:hypothetical protein